MLLKGINCLEYSIGIICVIYLLFVSPYTHDSITLIHNSCTAEGLALLGLLETVLLQTVDGEC